MKNRYIRNMNMLNEEESQKLKTYKVCVVGCGGLGGYIIEMLGRIGITYITAIDGDIFEESNLNRQLLSDELSIGKNKAEVAKERMTKVNSEVYINVINQPLEDMNGTEILKNHNVVIDALDNVETRLIIQKICKKLNIPLVHGAISGWYGQVCTIFPGDDTLNLIYKHNKRPNNKLGNPSFTPATVASIQVSEAIKLLLNKGENLRNKLLLIDLLNNDYSILELK
ncbi:HesA/MoeB/ThiF family protein [Romboutsia sp.]|uniref:HesA/MoeB/ThiF family protein n=1 Tax=Romboutsia sp. TaxID=1965302 RepID=UPI003F3F94C1